VQHRKKEEFRPGIIEKRGSAGRLYVLSGTDARLHVLSVSGDESIAILPASDVTDSGEGIVALRLDQFPAG
jgi:hypothetical protein